MAILKGKKAVKKTTQTHQEPEVHDDGLNEEYARLVDDTIKQEADDASQQKSLLRQQRKRSGTQLVLDWKECEEDISRCTTDIIRNPDKQLHQNALISAYSRRKDLWNQIQERLMSGRI